MDNFEIFAKDMGATAANSAIEAYKEDCEEFDPAWTKPMNYASGYTTAYLAREISQKWLIPLKRQARIAGISALVSLCFLIFVMFYIWSVVSFESFSKFLIAFIPAVSALVFSLSNSYKAWAEAKKHLAEAKSIFEK